MPVKRAELATPAALPSANALCGASSESGHRHDGQPPEQTQAGVLVNRRPLVVVGGGAGRGEEWGRGSRVTAKPRRGFWVRCDLTLPLLSPKKHVNDMLFFSFSFVGEKRGAGAFSCGRESGRGNQNFVSAQSCPLFFFCSTPDLWVLGGFRRGGSGEFSFFEAGEGGSAWEGFRVGEEGVTGSDKEVVVFLGVKQGERYFFDGKRSSPQFENSYLNSELQF